MYNGVEMIMQATAVFAIKLSVESIAESFISIYNLHNNKLRPISEDTAKAETMVVEADDILKTGLDLHFEGKPWHFILAGNIFKIHRKAVTEVFV